MNEIENTACPIIGEMPNVNEKNLSNDTTNVGIYGLQNRINKKWYVGQSLDIRKRWGKYRGMQCQAQPKLYNALVKYGVSNFDFQVLEECGSDKTTLDQREDHWIEVYDSINNGYNLKGGGANGKHSNETKQKMSITKLGKTFSDEHKQKISKSLIGRPVSAKTRKKISMANMGKSAPRRGKTHTQESIEKMRKAHRGKVISNETRIKLRNAMIGRFVSDETRQKRSASMKAVFAKKRLLSTLSESPSDSEKPDYDLSTTP